MIDPIRKLKGSCLTHLSLYMSDKDEGPFFGHKTYVLEIKYRMKYKSTILSLEEDTGCQFLEVFDTYPKYGNDRVYETIYRNNEHGSIILLAGEKYSPLMILTVRKNEKPKNY